MPRLTQRLGDDLATRSRGLSEVYGILEHDLDLAAHGGAVDIVRRAPSRCPRSRMRPALGAMRPRTCGATRGLAAAALADHAQRLAGVEIEADAVDGAQPRAGRRPSRPPPTRRILARSRTSSSGALIPPPGRSARIIGAPAADLRGPPPCCERRRLLTGRGRWHPGSAGGSGRPTAWRRRSASVPAMAGSRVWRRPDPGHGSEQQPGIGMARAREDIARPAPVSTICPAYITATRSAMRAITPMIVGDQQDRRCPARVAAARFISAQDLRLDRDVQRGGRLVGDEQARAGRRWPWRSSRAGACRPTADADSRRRARPAAGMPTCFSRAAACAPRLGRAAGRDARCSTSAIWKPTGSSGIEAGHRLLEDHGDGAAADLQHLGRRQAGEVAAVEHGSRRPSIRPCSPSRRHDGERRHGFARAAFADQPRGSRRARWRRRRRPAPCARPALREGDVRPSTASSGAPWSSSRACADRAGRAIRRPAG